MRLATMMIFMLSAIAIMVFTAIQANAVYPTSFGKYPPALYDVRGVIYGKVILFNSSSQYDWKSPGIANCYLAVVNASDINEEYYNTTTDMCGTFQITGINATWSSLDHSNWSSLSMVGNPAVGDGSLNAGWNAYVIYANKSPYGEAYSKPFGIGATEGDSDGMYTPIVFTWPEKLTLAADQFVNDVNGTDCARIHAYVYGNDGKPAMNGTIVDFMVNTSGWTPANGNLNGNNSQYASVVSNNGVASVYYGWFPGNRLPDSEVSIEATLHDFKDVDGVLNISFNGTSADGSTASTIPAPVNGSTTEPKSVFHVIVAPSPTATPAMAPLSNTTPDPKPIPPHPAIPALAVLAGMAIAYMRGKNMIRR